MPSLRLERSEAAQKGAAKQSLRVCCSDALSRLTLRRGRLWGLQTCKQTHCPPSKASCASSKQAQRRAFTRAQPARNWLGPRSQVAGIHQRLQLPCTIGLEKTNNPPHMACAASRGSLNFRLNDRHKVQHDRCSRPSETLGAEC